jgi:EmrB/QacA subfamily drug resistance transporter
MRRWYGNPWAVLLTLCLGFFMTLLDVTIVNIAIPDMLDALGASLDEVLWVINAYILVLTVMMITFGRLGDVRGPRTMFAAGVALFTLASLACGLASEPWMLIAFRALQGLGAAMLIPQTLTLLMATFPPHRRGAAFGIWGAVAGLATVTGPTLGGLLVTALGWQWIFFVNVPIGILVVVMALVIIPEPERRERHRLDLPGVLIASLALLCLTFGLVEGERFNWGQVWSFVSIPLLLATAGVLLVVFLIGQARRQHREPLVPFALFRDRSYAVMNAVAVTVMIALVGMFFPLTIYLQSVLGFSALKAGLTLAPMSLMSMVSAPIAGRLSDRTGGTYLLMGGLVVFGGGLAATAALAETTSTWSTFLVPLLVAGLGMGCVFPPMQAIAMRHVPRPLAGAASGVLNTVRQLGTVLGSAVVGAVLQARLATSLREEAVARAGALPEPARQPFVDAFEHASSGRLEVGAGQSGVDLPLPASLPSELVDQIATTAHQVFTHAYVAAMRPTLVIPIAMLAIGALLCLLAPGRTGSGDEQPPQATPDAATTAGRKLGPL